MQWVGRALSSVSQYYKEINPATLSGAIDVIIVEHTDTKAGTTTLACSPFHVRFGKLSVLRPTDRTVYIKINDQDAPFHMKVGDTGEAFFVFETDQDVPADLQTSPLTGPLGDDEGEEPEPLDLGESVSSLPADKDVQAGSSVANNDSREEQAYVEGKHESVVSRTLEDAARKVQTLGSGAIKLGGKAGDRIPAHENGGHGIHLPSSLQGRPRRRSSEESMSAAVLQSMAKKNAVTDEAFVASEFEGPSVALREGSESPVPFGTDPLERQRHRDEEAEAHAQAVQASQPQSSTSSSFTSGNAQESSERSNSAPQMAASTDLMLDMAGYKMEEADGDGLKTPPPGDMLSEQEALESQARSDMLHEADPDVLALTRALLRYSEARSGKPEHAHAPSPASSLSVAGGNEDMQDAANPYIFVMVSEGATHKFEISLCQSLDRASRTQGALPDASEFDASRVTNADFLKRPEVLQDSHLFIRFRERYFGWDNGSPALATLELYRKALIDGQPKGPPAQPAQRTGTWRRWWGGSRSRTTTEESVQLAASTPSTKQNTEVVASPSKEKEKDKDASATSPPATPSSPTFSQADTVVGEAEATSPPLQEPIPQQGKAKQEASQPSAPKHYAKTLRLTSDQLKALGLKKGANTISYTVQSSYSGVAVISSRVFLWESDYQVVISDIDGTITKSDALGHVFNMIGRDWTHPGVAKLYTDVAKNGYKMMYLTSRAIGQADVTRDYLKGIQQNGFTLPDGPVIMSPDRLLTSLHREVVLRKPEVFKMACLRDIKRLFVDRNPFYAGFGNRLTDGLSYRSVEIPSSRIFTIDSYGNVKLELLELAGYTSSYIAMTNLVDETFPPVTRSQQPAYNDFNYWRPAFQEVEFPDLTPPSPALSARSDSRMSVFRIAGVISKRASKSSLKPAPPNGIANGSDENARTPVSTSPRPSSPLQTIYTSEGEEEEYDEEEDNALPLQSQPAKRRSQRQRTESMPGSFEDQAFLEQMRESLELKPRAQTGTARSEIAQRQRSQEESDVDEGDEDDDDDDDEDDEIPEMDFGSIPYL